MSTWTETIGANPELLVDQIVQKGVSPIDAARLVSNLVAVNLGQSPRHFVYSSLQPGIDPVAGLPAFARTFSHQDWVDGESVVQASESPDDKGFNWRFNAIAADLDALNADTKNLFQALVAARNALYQALQDVAAELNRLDADVATLQQRLPAGTPPWLLNVADSPQFLGVRELDGGKVTMWKTGTGVMVLPGVDTVGLQDTVTQRLATGGLIARFAGSNQQFAADVSGGMAVKDLAAKWGDQPLGDGRTIGQALAVLPQDSTFTAPQAVVDAVNGQEQAFIRSTVGAISAVNTVTGVTSEGAPLKDISTGVIAGAVAGAPSNLSAGLAKAGLTNIADIAGTNAGDLVTKLGSQGVTIDQTQAAELTARASMLAGLGR